MECFKKHLKEFFTHIFHVYYSLHRCYSAELAFQATPTVVRAATPPSIMIQYGVLLTTLDILEFSSKFYLMFDVRSDSENDSYVRVSRGTQLLSLHYSITTTALSAMYFYGDL